MIGQTVTAKNGATYTIQNELGRGSFGIVYLAYSENRLPYAIKMIGPVKDSDTLLSFEREVTAVSATNHQNILGFIGQGEFLYSGATYFFTVTDYCSNGNYRGKLTGSSISIDQALNDFQQILAGLEALHQKVIHRDMKPENVLVAGSVLKIGDLGLSKSIDEATQSLTFKGGGTPIYMAPEVWERRKITPATDLYAVGVMLFEVTTGQTPFAANDYFKLRDMHLYAPAPRAKTLNATIPDHIDGLIRKLLEKDSAKRYQSAKEVLAIIATNTIASTTAELSALRSRMRQNYDANETKRLEIEQASNNAKKAREMLRYMEQKLVTQFDDVVQEVNKGIQETGISRHNGIKDVRYEFGQRALTISFFEPNEILNTESSTSLSKILVRHGVAHGGAIQIYEKGERRQGWNIVLVQSDDNPYGDWLLIESDMSPLSGRALRYPPAATDAQLLASNLAYHWMPAMHSWQLTDKPLEQSDIEHILGALIP